MDEPVIDGVQYVLTPRGNACAIWAPSGPVGPKTECIHGRALGLPCDDCRALRVKQVEEMKDRLGFQ